MGVSLIVLASALLCLAATTIGIRLWSRNIQRRGLVLNDYAAVSSLVRSIVKNISSILG